MKKLLSVALFIAFAGLASAQKTTTTVKKPQPVPPVKMKNLNDSASYAIGVSVANFYKQQGITKLNTVLVSKAINDILGGKTAVMDDATANAVMNKCLSSLQEDKSRPNIEAGQKFLAQNKLRAGVITTATGLQYEILTQGTGAKPGPNDSVTCNYLGVLVNGTEFDNSYKRGQPITFSLNRVIAGWTEALQLMNVGSKYKLYVPYTMGYGAFDYGPIPGGSALIFEVELLDVHKGLPQEGIKD